MIETASQALPQAPSRASERTVTDGAATMGIATTRELERVAATMGLLEAAPLRFEPADDLPDGGTLCALPALLAFGLLDHQDQAGLTLPKGFYSLPGIFLLIGLVVTAEGFPLTYEIFSGNTIDVTTLEHIVQTVEAKHGKARRVWVFDRGINSEKNLEWLRQRGAFYLVGTPKSQLTAFECHLTEHDWQKAAPEVEVKLCPTDSEIHILCRSAGRIQKENAMRRRAIKSLIRDLIKLRNLIAKGKLKDQKTIDRRITIPEQEQAAILLQLGWTLPQQPPPRIRSRQHPVPA